MLGELQSLGGLVRWSGRITVHNRELILLPASVFPVVYRYSSVYHESRFRLKQKISSGVKIMKVEL